MALLLDTQAIIWMEGDPSKIPTSIKNQIFTEPSLFISKVSAWEMAIKIKTSKLSLKKSLDTFILDFIRDYRCQLLDIELAHIYHTQYLPLHHRDPFDRLLIAQALHQNFRVVSSDAMFDAYNIQRIWQM